MNILENRKTTDQSPINTDAKFLGDLLELEY